VLPPPALAPARPLYLARPSVCQHARPDPIACSLLGPWPQLTWQEPPTFCLAAGGILAGLKLGPSKGPSWLELPDSRETVSTSWARSWLRRRNLPCCRYVSMSTSGTGVGIPMGAVPLSIGRWACGAVPGIIPKACSLHCTAPACARLPSTPPHPHPPPLHSPRARQVPVGRQLRGAHHHPHLQPPRQQRSVLRGHRLLLLLRAHHRRQVGGVHAWDERRASKCCCSDWIWGLLA
jgi:hypothetical protein